MLANGLKSVVTKWTEVDLLLDLEYLPFNGLNPLMQDESKLRFCSTPAYLILPNGFLSVEQRGSASVDFVATDFNPLNKEAAPRSIL